MNFALLAPSKPGDVALSIALSKPWCNFRQVLLKLLQIIFFPVSLDVMFFVCFPACLCATDFPTV